MGDIKGFVMSLVCASAASALIDGFVPDGGIKKYVRYLISLSILLVLLSPLKSLVTSLPELIAVTDASYGDIDAMTRANSVIAMHIETAVAEKFSLNLEEVDARYENGKINVSVKQHIGILESDVALFILNNYGIEAEVSIYE